MYKDNGRKRKGDDVDNEQIKAKNVKTNDTPPVEQCGDASDKDARMNEGEGLKKEVRDIRVLSKVQWKKIKK